MDKPKNSDRIAEILEQEPTLTNTEVARRVGVARTYVHQVRNKLGLPPANRRKDWHPCAACGTLVPSRKRYCDKLCAYNMKNVTCETCGKVFPRSQRVIRRNEERGYQHIWCSKECQGSWFGSFKRRIQSLVGL